jgi:hypothetical protein
MKKIMFICLALSQMTLAQKVEFKVSEIGKNKNPIGALLVKSDSCLRYADEAVNAQIFLYEIKDISKKKETQLYKLIQITCPMGAYNVSTSYYLKDFDNTYVKLSFPSVMANEISTYTELGASDVKISKDKSHVLISSFSKGRGIGDIYSSSVYSLDLMGARPIFVSSEMQDIKDFEAEKHVYVRTNVVQKKNGIKIKKKKLNEEEVNQR